MTTKLTIQQEKFAQKYAECGVASEAYRFAYPKSKKWKDKSVWEVSSAMLANPKVRSRVEELRAKLSAKTEMTREAKLSLLEEMLSVRTQDYFHPDGEWKGFDQLTEAQSKALKSFKKTVTMAGDNFAIELYSKMDILAMMNKMCGHDAPTQIDLAVRAPKAMTQQEIEDEINKLNND